MIAPPFDLHRLYQEINAERQRQNLSWNALSRQVHVAASTIRRYASADDAEADGVLALIHWLDATPEDYITNNSITPTRLPPAAHGQPRVDMDRVAEATKDPLDPRGANGRTRTTIQRLVGAAQHSGQSVASLTRLTEL